MNRFNVPKWVREEFKHAKENEWPRVVSYWAPRHFEIVRIAHLFKEVAKLKRLPLRVVEPGTGYGLTAYLLALEGISVRAFEKDAYRLPGCKQFLPFFERRKRKLGLKSTLEYLHDHIKNIDNYKGCQMMFASWPGPSTLDQEQYYGHTTYDFRPLWARMQPEVIIVTEQIYAAHRETPVCMSEKPYRYNYLTGWLSQSHSKLKENLKDIDELTTVEAYGREKLNIKMPKDIDDVEPYPWEDRLYPVSGRAKLARELYKFNNGPLSA